MLNYFQAIIFGSIQGITELFPISSLGHSVILPSLLNWNIDQKDPFFLVFLVATHAATSLALFFYFWQDWKRIILAILNALRHREISEKDPDSKFGWLLIIGTIPAGILGLLLEDFLKGLFASPQIVAGVLSLNGVMLLAAELLRRNKKEVYETGSNQRIAKLSYFQAILVGMFQCLALIPGFSRTGSTITGSLLMGLAHEDAARFSFLLATPIIGAAAFLKLPSLIFQTNLKNLGPTLTGMIFAAFFAYLSVKYLTRYFQSKSLTPFGLYCLITGVVLFLWFLGR